MTTAGSANGVQGAGRALSILIVGPDAVLAAAPATPVQLAHACLEAGYDAAVPASWGDELIAASVLRELRDRESGPVVQCSCPLVSRRLLSLGSELRPFLVSTVSPPVATARYLRALHEPTRLRITYVGRCPCAVDEDIDARLTPEELLAVFGDRSISLAEQPIAFDSIIPPDRRRFRSQPGGVPRTEALAAFGRELAEMDGGDLSIELGQLLLTGGNVLVDLAPRLGCVCSGAEPAVATPGDEARARVAELEPPLATGPVVDERVPVRLEVPVAVPSRLPPEIATTVPVTPAADLWSPAEASAHPPARAEGAIEEAASPGVVLPPEAVTPMSRRKSPGQGIRALAGPMSTTRIADGRPLPRTYVGRRRSSPRGLRALSGEIASAPHVEASAAPLAATAVEPSAEPSSPTVEASATPVAATSIEASADLSATTVEPSGEPGAAPSLEPTALPEPAAVSEAASPATSEPSPASIPPEPAAGAVPVEGEPTAPVATLEAGHQTAHQQPWSTAATTETPMPPPRARRESRASRGASGPEEPRGDAEHSHAVLGLWLILLVLVSAALGAVISRLLW